MFRFVPGINLEIRSGLISTVQYPITSQPLLSLHLLALPVMASRDKLKNVGKNIIEYPEETVPVPSTVDWVRNVIKDPKLQVSPSASRFAVLILLTRILGDRLCHKAFSYIRMDKTIQYVFILSFSTLVRTETDNSS